MPLTAKLVKPYYKNHPILKPPTKAQAKWMIESPV